MGLFSKLFGKPEPQCELLEIPDGATTGEVIALAIQAVVKKSGGNCATLQLAGNPDDWVQVMDCTVNCQYPHDEAPDIRFPELCNSPLVAGIEGFEPQLFMTVSLNNMDTTEVVKWIERYFSEVLSVDLEQVKLKIRMEEI